MWMFIVIFCFNEYENKILILNVNKLIYYILILANFSDTNEIIRARKLKKFEWRPMNIEVHSESCLNIQKWKYKCPEEY